MRDKLFIDTNVLIDVVTNRSQPHVIFSQRLFAEAYMGKVELYVSALSFVTTVYVARKYHLSESDTKASLMKLSTFLNVVDLTSDDVLTMLNSNWIDYEDSVQNEAAMKINADYIITGNVDDFCDSFIKVLTPQQYLDI